MRKLTTIKILLFFTFIFVGCASHQKANLKEKKFSQIVEIDWEERVSEARKQGANAEKFLATELFLKGNSALLEGDYATGVKIFEQLSKLTDEVFVHKKYAVALIRLGHLDESRLVLEKLWERKIDDETVGLILGGVYGALEKTTLARATYQEVLAKNPNQEDACLFLGKMLIEEKNWKQADTWMRKCQLKHPKEGSFTYYLGKMYIEKGDFKSALKAFQESHKREPTSTQAAAAIGVVLEQQEQSEEAVAFYKKHLEGKPQDEVVLGRLVQALFVMERFLEVIPFAERLVDLDPDNLNMRVKLGILYTDSKEFEKAISVFRELLTLAPQSDKILYYLGAIHQEQNRIEQAIDYFAQIPVSSGLYQDSSFQVANMLNSLAQVEYGTSNSEGPIGKRFLETVDTKISELPELRVELSVLKANYLEAVEKDDSAIAELIKVKDEKNFGIQHHYYLASLYEKTKKFKESTDIVMSLIKADPKNAHAWNFLGYSMLERGDSPEDALPYIQKAVKLAPEDGYIRDSLGWYYFKTGQTSQALRELKIAYSKAPEDIVIAKHLALIHQHMKNYNEARSIFQAALKNAKLTSERREVTNLIKVLESSERIPASEIRAQD